MAGHITINPDKLSLGSAQFGLDYGIANKKGKVSRAEALEILDYAYASGIDTIDTARAYGESEEIIGEFIERGKPRLKVISKLPSCSPDKTEEFFNKSLKKLNLGRIYGYLVHDPASFPEKIETWNILRRLKDKGKIEKIGFSLYYPREAEYFLAEKIKPDIIQIPFSVLDQRFLDIFPLLKAQNIEIHARSVFLQGLVFKDPDEINPGLTGVKDKIFLLESISEESGVPLPALCINFVMLNEHIEKLIIGVDSLTHLQENIKALTHCREVRRLYNRLLLLREDDESIILPPNWGKKTQKAS